MTTAEKILQKKTVYKAEMDKIMPVEQSDVLWKKAAGKLDSIMEQYGSLPKGVKMHTDRNAQPVCRGLGSDDKETFRAEQRISEQVLSQEKG